MIRRSVVQRRRVLRERSDAALEEVVDALERANLPVDVGEAVALLAEFLALLIDAGLVADVRERVAEDSRLGDGPRSAPFRSS